VWHALVELLGVLVEAMRHAADMLPRFGVRLVDDLARITSFATLPGAWVLLVLSVLIASLLFAVLATAHWAWMRLRRPVTTVFVSYEHRREASAAEVEQALRREGLRVRRLPFLEEVDHDQLLDAVHAGVRGCDVVVCIPGQRSSFVDVEVAMAFALGKPMFFVLDPAAGTRLPNTAKKGYPLFDENALRAGGHRVLAAFARIVASDSRAVIGLYSGALREVKRSIALVFGTWVLCLSVGSQFVDRFEVDRMRTLLAELPQSLWEGGPGSGPLLTYVVVNGVLIALPFAALALSQAWLRRRAANAVAGQRFASLVLPGTLDARLSRGDLMQSLVSADVLARHEPGTPAFAIAGRTLPFTLTEPAVKLMLGMTFAVVMLLGSLAGIVLLEHDIWILPVFFGLNLLLGAVLTIVVAFELPRRRRQLEITAEGFTYCAAKPPLRFEDRTVFWTDVESFEWIEVGKAWWIGWSTQASDTKPVPVWGHGFGLQLPELMAMLRELHAHFKPPSAPGNRG